MFWNNFKAENIAIDLESYDEIAELPQEWVDLLTRLHPVTAIVVWELLTNQLSFRTIELAKVSPDTSRFIAISMVADSDGSDLAGLTAMAREELFEILDEAYPEQRSRRVLL